MESVFASPEGQLIVQYSSDISRIRLAMRYSNKQKIVTQYLFNKFKSTAQFTRPRMPLAVKGKANGRNICHSFLSRSSGYLRMRSDFRVFIALLFISITIYTFRFHSNQMRNFGLHNFFLLPSFPMKNCSSPPISCGGKGPHLRREWSHNLQTFP